ncbi:MAG: hypothetical protein OXF02_03625 [Simkaniaceae bacterium]|nr:hypothetical protein [Simkaniaceae bacterium]
MPGQTIDENPLDALVEKREDEMPDKGKNGRGGKDRLTITISNETLERARDAVFWVRGATLTGLVERGVEPAIEELAKS